MDEELNTSSPLAGGADVTSTDGKENDSEVVSIHEVLSAELGRTFKDDDEAMKAVKDTFSFVGKAGKYQAAVKAIMNSRGVDEEGAIKIMEQTVQSNSTEVVDKSNLATKEELEAVKSQLWFKDHPDYATNQALISQLAKTRGQTLDEVVNSDDVKSLFEKATAYEQSQKTKSVLNSNPRIGAVSDKMAKANEAAKAGNSTEAAKSATEAVLEAFELK